MVRLPRRRNRRPKWRRPAARRSVPATLSSPRSSSRKSRTKSRRRPSAVRWRRRNGTEWNRRRRFWCNSTTRCRPETGHRTGTGPVPIMAAAADDRNPEPEPEASSSSPTTTTGNSSSSSEADVVNSFVWKRDGWLVLFRFFFLDGFLFSVYRHTLESGWISNIWWGGRANEGPRLIWWANDDARERNYESVKQ